ncbi:hypothetical protein A4A49_35743 [Nicotiana attenuata]|uniref:Uncharacterized protein n=1 Tax=Nicotiana attenuata TaxID=49451 RepID=A0A1J6KBP8_NICAT|nr:hypothetical protein A4A49_35743 [Nicotiana attenuata]
MDVPFKRVKVFDIRNCGWGPDIPRLKAPKPAPFVFSLNGMLYVLSTSVSDKEPHFEMLDTKDHSGGWLPLPDPSFVSDHILPSNHAKIIDYSKNMLYVRLVHWSYIDCTSDLYGYNVHDHKWHTFQICMSEEDITSSSSSSQSTGPSPLTARTANLLKASWFNGCVIVENYLYRFQMFRYPKQELRAILIIRDLEHEVDVHNNSVELDYVDNEHSKDDPPIEGSWEVDISNVVHKVVLDDNYAVGHLVYQGKRNTCSRFSLVILYASKATNHVCTCTFELEVKSDKAAAVGESSTRSFIAKPIACKSRGINIDTAMFSCKGLCKFLPFHL